MSYSAIIGQLETLKSNLTDNKSSVDKVDLDGSWKGAAHDKQASNVKDLGSGVDSQISNIESLITAMKAADAYDEAKKAYDTASSNRAGLNTKASDYSQQYQKYSDEMDTAEKEMKKQKEAAEGALGGIGDSYDSKLSDISTTDLKATTFVKLSSAVSELAPDTVDVNKNATPSSEWSNIGSSNNSGSYSSSGSYSGSNNSSGGRFTYTVGSKSSSDSSAKASTSAKDAKTSLTDLAETDMSGKEITIPDDVKQGGYTVTGYDYWVQSGDVMVWAAGTNQEKVSEIWKKQGSRFKNGIAVINVDGEDRYLVAVTTTFGQVGDCIDVQLEDGTVVKCIIGDSKGSGSDTGSEWGHPFGDGSINVLEFEVERATTLKLGNPTTEKWGLDWDSSKKVKSMKNLGSIIGAKETDNTIKLTDKDNDSSTATTVDADKETNSDSSSDVSDTSSEEKTETESPAEATTDGEVTEQETTSEESTEQDTTTEEVTDGDSESV